MHELVRTKNAVLITAIEALLKGAEIPHVVLDQHMSVLEGSLGMLPRRIVVDQEYWEAARQLLQDAGLAHELRPVSGGPKPETTDDAVLGGRLRLKQKKKGHRVGHDAILLAAATDAQPGDRVVEFGAGVGAAGLALAVRCPGRDVTLVEIDPELSDIAAQNIVLNGLDQRARAVTLDVAAPADDFAAHGIGAGLRRSCADEPAVQQSGPAECFARSRAPHGACGRRRHRSPIGWRPRRGFCTPPGR